MILPSYNPAILFQKMVKELQSAEPSQIKVEYKKEGNVHKCIFTEGEKSAVMTLDDITFIDGKPVQSYKMVSDYGEEFLAEISEFQHGVLGKLPVVHEAVGSKENMTEVVFYFHNVYIPTDAEDHIDRTLSSIRNDIQFEIPSIKEQLIELRAYNILE